PNHTTLRGTGRLSVLRMDDDDFDDNRGMLNLGHQGFLAQTVENITVESLVLDGNRNNMAVGNERDGILATSNTLLRDIRLRDLHIHSQGHYGIGLQGDGAVFDNVGLERIKIEFTGEDAFDAKPI